MYNWFLTKHVFFVKYMVFIESVRIFSSDKYKLIYEIFRFGCHDAMHQLGKS